MNNLKLKYILLLVFLITILININCEKKPTAPVRNNPLDTKGVFNYNTPSVKDSVYVPAGEFTMGSTSYYDEEQPVHTVYLDDYYIDKYEVTNEQYAAYLNEALANSEINASSSTVTKDGYELLDLDYVDCQISYSGSNFIVDSGKEYYPVILVTWYGADAYAKHFGKRLPTEAEWEKAARGTDERIYPWGNDDPTSSHCNFWSNIYHTTTIGIYRPLGDSPYGCCDMAGNVEEWCNDWYSDDYYKSSPTNNPQGPSSGDYHVLRGGSWFGSNYHVRCANRDFDYPSGRGSTIGFRCVR